MAKRTRETFLHGVETVLEIPGYGLCDAQVLMEARAVQPLEVPDGNGRVLRHSP
jgi:hypothetical protein